MGFPSGSVVKNLPANTADAGSIPGSGRYPGGGNGNHSSILAWEPHGQRSLAGYCSWGHERVEHDLVIDIIFYLFPLKQLNKNRYF